jgi:hypothetical protein
MDITADIGLFAQLNWIVFLLRMCEKKGLKPCILLKSTLYQGSEENEWFRALFSYKLLKDRDIANIARIPPVKISELSELSFDKHTRGGSLTIKSAHNLFSKFIAISPDILGYVDGFCKERFSGEKVLGIHYRGTDKTEEAPRISYEECCLIIDKKLVELNGVSSIFVSSDEGEFVLYLKTRYKDRINVHYHDDVHRSVNGKSIHRERDVGDNFQKAKEALVNCLILSRTDYLIKTASFLSAWSCVFNPELPVELINVPHSSYLWFPDSEIVNRGKGGAR